MSGMIYLNFTKVKKPFSDFISSLSCSAKHVKHFLTHSCDLHAVELTLLGW